MGDMREAFDDLREFQKSEKEMRMKVNLAAINISGIDYTPNNNGYQLNFYLDELPAISFYPSTNKWVMLGRSYRGNAESFLKWLKKIRERE